MKTLWISQPEAINGATDMSYHFLDTKFNSRYSIERDARDKINKMFGLNTRPD